MKVILIKEVEKLGYKDQVVEVAPGYANNFLIPQGMAKAATSSALKVLAENLRQQAHKEEKLIAQAQVVADKLAAISLSFTVKSEEGRIHGSITAADIAEELGKKGVEIDRKSISMPAVKQTGEYEASVRLYKEVKGTVKFTVAAEDAPAPQAAPETPKAEAPEAAAAEE